MKIALVNYRVPPIWMSIELSTIIATLKQEGHDVHLIDLAFTPKKKAEGVGINELRKLNPDAIGIHVCKEFEGLLRLIEGIRRKVGGQPILVSRIDSPHFTYDLRMVQRKGLENVWTFGEQASSEIAAFLKGYERGQLPKDTHIIPSIKNPNDFPILDFRLFDVPRYFNEIIMLSHYLPINASSGCAYDCSLCTCKDLPYLHKRPERILEEVLVQESRHRKDGLRSFGFHDSLFGLHKRYFNGTMRYWDTKVFNLERVRA